MKRNDISGFTIRLLGYSIEFVTVKNKPAILAIWRHTRLIKRFGI